MKKQITFREISEIQQQFDMRHGFVIEKSDIGRKYGQITKDLIGLFGEVGEFSNIVKKINLSIDYKKEIDEKELDRAEDSLREELIDIFIYLMRLSNSLDIDLEKDYLRKMKKNEIKYSSYE